MKKLLLALGVLALGILIGIALEAVIGKWATIGALVIVIVIALINLMKPEV